MLMFSNPYYLIATMGKTECFLTLSYGRGTARNIIHLMRRA